MDARALIVCPRDHSRLEWSATEVRCEHKHTYSVIHGVPVLLMEEAAPNHPNAFERSLRGEFQDLPQSGPVDPFVQQDIVNTNGRLFRQSIGRLTDYPVPNIPLPETNGGVLVDIGANWGRWSISAARKGYRVVAVDPMLDGALAGTRIRKQLGLDITFVVGDARHLPLANKAVEVAFSYSVLQHFSKDDVITSLKEMARVAKERVLVQMANKYGPLQIVNQLTQRSSGVFRVRHWTPAELLSTFDEFIGPSSLTVDGFFSLNAQLEERRFLPKRYAAVITLSSWLTSASRKMPFLTHVADSLYVTALPS